jgi:hypothetical protein
MSKPISFGGKTLKPIKDYLLNQGLIGVPFGPVQFSDNQRFEYLYVTVRDPDFISNKSIVGSSIQIAIVFAVNGHLGASIDYETATPVSVNLRDSDGNVLATSDQIAWGAQCSQTLRYGNGLGELIPGIDIRNIEAIELLPMSAADDPC